MAKPKPPTTPPIGPKPRPKPTRPAAPGAVVSCPYVLAEADATEDGWDDPARGRVSWRTLFSADTFPSEALSGGIGYLEPGGFLALHRHAPAEIYFILDGHPVVTIDGVEHAVGPNAGVFIPGDAEHGIRNDTTVPVRFFYAFAVDRFSAVEYRFPGA